VIEAVIDTTYRRLIAGRSIDISLGGIIIIDVAQLTASAGCEARSTLRPADDNRNRLLPDAPRPATT